MISFFIAKHLTKLKTIYTLVNLACEQYRTKTIMEYTFPFRIQSIKKTDMRLMTSLFVLSYSSTIVFKFQHIFCFVFYYNEWFSNLIIN